MKIQKLLEKNIAISIIMLLTTAIIPSVNAGIAINNEKILINNDIEPLNLLEPIVNLDGQHGLNFWWISTVTVSFLYSPDEVKEIWYKIGTGNFQQYKDNPFTVSKEGKNTLAWYYIDDQGINHSGTAKPIWIDITPPTIKISKVVVNDEVTFTATCTDKTSGVERVEFYLDDELKAVDNTSTYTWTWTGTDAHLVFARGYDMAGLYKDSEKISTPRSINNFLQFINEILQRIIYRIIN